MADGPGYGNTDVDPIASELAEALDQAGYRHALAPVAAARSLWEEISSLRDQGLLADRMFEAYQDSWRFVEPQGVAEPRTLVAVAWASLPLILRFQMKEPFDALVPPTYVYSGGRTRCLEVARSVLQRYEYRVDWARLPVKLLAVRTGLARYGRNNLAYIPGLGSYARLEALCTDAEFRAPRLEAPPARVHEFMDECGRCRACSRACPTDCIPPRGTVIDAAHCLTEANENEGAWPDWVPARAHNSLVGCMRCQEACPVDRAYLGLETKIAAEFTQEETAAVLEGRPAHRLPDALRAKLEGLDLDEYSTVLGRNLLALQQSTRP